MSYRRTAYADRVGALTHSQSKSIAINPTVREIGRNVRRLSYRRTAYAGRVGALTQQVNRDKPDGPQDRQPRPERRGDDIRVAKKRRHSPRGWCRNTRGSLKTH